MDLTVGEKIMVLRQRKGLNLLELGKALKTTRRGKNIKNPNIKLKKIEAGQLKADKEELKALAKALDVHVDVFKSEGLNVSEEILVRFPKLQFYLETIIKAYDMGDEIMLKNLIERLEMS